MGIWSEKGSAERSGKGSDAFFARRAVSRRTHSAGSHQFSVSNCMFQGKVRRAKRGQTHFPPARTAGPLSNAESYAIGGPVTDGTIPVAFKLAITPVTRRSRPGR